ncbi:flagellar basal body rod protein FlgC [Alicyclobacillus sp. TC]|uniref:Flagellar basal-body rod protein FlgC n=2 Tax=Alicyclobacillus tolerans TaxID=90970 RepID=A0A1M6RRD6_9BACL|nr:MULTISPECIES: flagellar basal body rod protein FlgC [Alicyclobacillus]MDP9728840.1 flagellar basal-body rod protein FlgC [Alicyclobacillus tengchongensis]QRF23725.1 flagellar basal body rod protein FlgC [Alicyclobacillus sp. TC]SHK35026.1 flagellar basal-body rod protein FlgC [Alicyclobacillus montanus]
MAGWMGSLSISASGLTAQRLVMDVVSNNIANADTTRTPQGGPYRKEIAILQPIAASGSFADALQQAGVQNVSNATDGVQVSAIVQAPGPFKLVYDPSSPDAVNGYVEMPNVNISTEMVDLMSASRAYEANATAFDATKSMMMSAINLGK